MRTSSASKMALLKISESVRSPSNDCQAEGLDEELDGGPGTQISFVKLTLLVGG